MASTFVEKALARGAGLERVRAGQTVDVQPDVILSHDNTAAIARIFHTLGRPRVLDPDRLAITLDHAVPAPTTLHAANHAEVRQFVAAQGVRHFFEAGRGICHQVLSEEALVLPGQALLGADSHSTHFGWLGAFGAGVGRSEVAALWATGRLWLRVPETIRIELYGQLPPWVTAKDLSLWLLRLLGAGGAAYMALEIAGPGLAGLSLESRMVLPNMMAEAGAKSAYLPPDAAVFDWLAARLAARSGETVATCRQRLVAGALYPDPGAAYAGRLQVDLDHLEPLAALPHSPHNVAPISSLGRVRVHQAFIGTCTNGRLEDIAAAAAVLQANGRVHTLAPGTRLLVTPASSQVLRQAIAAGYVDTLLAAGATIGVPGCGPCMGNHMGVPAPGEVTISSANRNFRGRMGTADSDIYLASPAVVAASAVLGRIASPAEVAGEGPQMSQISQMGGRVKQSAQSAQPVLSLPSNEVKGAAEVSAVSSAAVLPAVTGRVWKYGDEVDTDAMFPGKYTYTLRQPEEWARHALEDLDPGFAAAVQPGDVIVAGRNWGCGSSREQAVGCLKAAGVAAIVAASFARIYYRNAVNNGLLPIICPAAVAAIQPGETITIDLQRCVIVREEAAEGAEREFAFAPLSPTLMRILAAGGLIPLLKHDHHLPDPR